MARFGFQMTIKEVHYHLKGLAGFRHYKDVRRACAYECGCGMARRLFL
jgi:hypothetical protein